MRRLLPLSLGGLLACSSSSFAVVANEEDTGTTTGDTSFDSPIETNPDAPPLPCDPKDVPPEGGVFVSPAGSDLADGSRDKPLRSVTAGLAVARGKGKSKVYLDVGTYEETVTMNDADPGITVEGGWRRIGDGWRRNCDLKAADQTIIQSSDAIAVRASNNGHPSGLRILTVLTRAKGADGGDGAAGQSVVGVLVKGAATRFPLDRVIVVAGDAGSGGSAGVGLPGTDPPPCDGKLDCNDGAEGKVGAEGTVPTSTGTFGDDGYTPASGGDAAAGSVGNNGKPGGKPTPVTCVDSCSSGCVTTGTCAIVTTSSRSGSPGRCGCGGPGGSGGVGGKGGGASVALLVVGGKVTIDRVSLRAAKGGNGSHGGTGQPGKAGTGGSSGAPASFGCYTGCSSYTGSCSTGFVSCYTGGTYITPGGGEAGGSGGTGGVGGNGGGGPGGPSYSVVLAAGGTLDGVAALLKFDTGGTGSNGAPNGGTGEKFVQP